MSDGASPTLARSCTNLPKSVRKLLDDTGVPLTGRRVLALCSGGIDSVVLVWMLAHLPRGAAPASLDVLWLNHGYRANIDAEREAARSIADAVGAGFHVRERASNQPVAGGGRQNDARTWRYETAREIACELQCTHVATGHTASDQVEGALLGLVGVTGPGRPSVMRVSRPLGDTCMLVRPLLGLSRADIEQVARDAALEWAEDPSNEDPNAYVRNHIRQHVAPQLLEVAGGGVRALARAAERDYERAASAPELARELLSAWQSSPGDPLDVRRLQRLDGPARRELIAAWLRGAQLGRSISARVVCAIDQLISRPSVGLEAVVDIAGAHRVRRTGYDLSIDRTTPLENPHHDHS